MENRVRPNFECFIQRYWTTEKKGKKKYDMIDHNEGKRKKQITYKNVLKKYW